MNKFKVAFTGLYKAIKDKSVMIQMILALITLCAGLVLRFTYGEWLACIICIGMVISSEIFNTCIERLCDVYTVKDDDKIGYIKDIAAGAVLVTALVSLMIMVMIVIRRL